MTLLQFMDAHPILTFLLACVLAEGLVGLAMAARGRKCKCEKRDG